MNISICVDESDHGGIVISGLEVIESGVWRVVLAISVFGDADLKPLAVMGLACPMTVLWGHYAFLKMLHRRLTIRQPRIL